MHLDVAIRRSNPLLGPDATRLLQEEILAAVAELHRLRKELDDKSAAAGGDAGGERHGLLQALLRFLRCAGPASTPQCGQCVAEAGDAVHGLGR
jgi:hypothetical protein